MWGGEGRHLRKCTLVDTHTQEEKHFESWMRWHVPVIPAPLELKQENFKFQTRPNLQNKGRQTLIYEKSVWMMGNFWRQEPNNCLSQ